MSEIKNGGLDQYGNGAFEPQQFNGTAGVGRVNYTASQLTDVLNQTLLTAEDYCKLILV